MVDRPLVASRMQAFSQRKMIIASLALVRMRIVNQKSLSADTISD